ncbi:MAG: hypothetical protein ACFFDJ_07870, partial [Candidatus Odinarchaeota archaeon]
MTNQKSSFYENMWVHLPNILAIVAIVFCITLRIVPAYLLGVPFLPDPWVHIGKADEILQSGFFNIWGDYDDHWPGLNVLVSLLALFTGVDPIVLGQYVLPIVCSFALIFFYLLMRHLTGNNTVALVSLLLLGFAAPLTLIMGTTYKEALARFFLLAALLAFVIRNPKDLAHVLPVILLVVVIIPVHHVAFLIAGSILVFVVISLQVYNLRIGILTFRP